ncbi:MAG: ECF transporter S component [Peptostreptococcus porci]|uniref:ECF transporter S component n=1 Tax=Peptostreptococcus porci TaxID=2652282 RepID=A0A6N7XEX7_9FIRM|nr:ECF transporter S component [Peptostreptococcus porci]MDY2795150.1 ECF transporter S component [Peptostreptococcus porci]MDY4560304.1 ECF transporter S component [Peptostreptococcus porci]MDY5479401.1 ECF transporter S component [Peptostreptococcus porci]MDY6233000.1 ECF transporter S component [Peptostreptococcus porci]MST61759.1 ECF transporter S component [Peptostreptococcus porci]
MRNEKLTLITQTAILAALCFVTFTFLQIKIPVPGGDATSIHFGNVFLVLAALLIGGVYGGLAGAIGMTIADILDPVYIIVAPKTFILKLCIGLIVGAIAHKYAKINESDDKKYIIKWAIIASIVGMSFNVVADPIVGYFYKVYIIGQPADVATILAKLSAGVTFFNAITTVVIANLIYVSLRPILIKSNLLVNYQKSKKAA